MGDMATSRGGGLVGQIGRLFERGTVAGLPEGQILQRYAVHRDDAAFEALVGRHGSTVLGVWRRLLRDPNDVDLPVLPPEPGPIPKPTQGSFEVAGSAPGLAFGWHAIQSYRPEPRPADFRDPKPGLVVFSGQPIVSDLVLGPPARVRGRVVDDRGHPVVGAATKASPMLALNPGETTTARFAFGKRAEPAAEAGHPEEDEVGGRLRTLWEAQARLIRRGRVRATQSFF